ncbi:hypothetical protein [Allosphingosinicella deserti]|uniref:hypothetical protein n=1 Tax=Allosphingosinicella deserti TaxID=2116704 RepID=UPI000D0BA437|nr:hypothetical protein [Sphingomonas deserti]
MHFSDQGSRIVQDGGDAANDDHQGGTRAVYRPGDVRSCPECGGAHWLVGRLLAECNDCGTAVPLGEVKLHGAGADRGRRGWKHGRAA